MSTPMIEKMLNEIKQFMSQQAVLKKDILNVKEAALYAGVSTSYLYKLTSKRSISFHRPESKLIYFSRTELDNWLLSNRQATTRELSVITPAKRKGD